MTRIVSATSKDMSIEKFVTWLKSDESSILIKTNFGQFSFGELNVRYPYSLSLPNAEVVTTMVVEDKDSMEKNGTWERIGVWFKDKHIFLCKYGRYFRVPDVKEIRYADVIYEMKEALLSKVFSMCMELYPTLEDLKPVANDISYVMDEELNRKVDLSWILGNLNTNAKELFISDMMNAYVVKVFNDDSAVHWIAGDRDNVPGKHLQSIKEDLLKAKNNPAMKVTDITDYLVAFKRAVLIADKAKKYVETPKALTAVKISRAATAYLKDHEVKNFKILCRNDMGDEFVGQIPGEDLSDAAGVYLRLDPKWKGEPFKNKIDKWSCLPTPDQVIRISYKKDIVYSYK